MSESIRPESQSALELAGALQTALRSSRESEFPLDVQQEASIEGIGIALVSGKTAGYVEMATGTGKTRAEALLTEAAVKAGMRVLLLAPSITAAEQISGKSTESPKGLAKFTDLHQKGGRNIVRHHFGNRRGNRTAPVVVSTYNGFLNDFKNEYAALGQFDLVIADECHKSLGKQTSQALKEAYPGAIRIGMSATPDYAVNRKSDEVYTEQLYEFSLADAIEQGKTAPVRSLIIETDSTIKLVDQRSEFTDREQAPLAIDAKRNGIICNLAQDFVNSGRQGIVACVAGEGNLHARSIAQMLSRPEFGSLKAADIGGHLSPEEVSLRLKQFERGEIEVLTSTRAILESWDSSRASFCINAAPTVSSVKVKQLMGRILRTKEDGSEGIFVDLVDSQTGIRKLQYTGLHALGLQDVDYDRVLGQYTYNPGKQYEMRVTDLPEFSADLMTRLKQVQGRTLVDIFKPKLAETEDPLFKQWEKVLAKEGMPSELGGNLVIPERFMNIYNKALVRYIRQEGVAPTNSEILEIIKDKITKEAAVALKFYGVQLAIDTVDSLETTDDATSSTMGQFITDRLVALDDIAGIEVHTEEDIIENLAMGHFLPLQLAAVLGTLSEREEGVISLRYGITPPYSDAPKRAFVKNTLLQAKLASIDPLSEEEVGYITGRQPQTFDNIGKVYGVLRERVRQIESKTMHKLIHPSRSEVLIPYLDATEPGMKELSSQKKIARDNHDTYERLKKLNQAGQADQVLGEMSLMLINTKGHTAWTGNYAERQAADKLNERMVKPYAELFGIATHNRVSALKQVNDRQEAIIYRAEQLAAVYAHQPTDGTKSPELYESIRKELVLLALALQTLNKLEHYFTQ